MIIAVQRLGQPSVEEVKDYVNERLKTMAGGPFKLQLRSVDKYCTILQKKALISMGYRETEDGQLLVYNMQRGYVKFPEKAQISDVVKDAAFQPYLDRLESAAGAKKKILVYDNYVCAVRWRVTGEGVAGFWPKNKIHSHYRNSAGEITFFPSHFKKYLQKNLDKVDKSKYVADRIGFLEGQAVLQKDVPCRVVQVPILVTGQIPGRSGGAGIKDVEVLPAGTEILTEFSVPRSEFVPEEFERFLGIIGKYGNVGFGAHASRFGKLELSGFKVVVEHLWPKSKGVDK